MLRSGRHRLQTSTTIVVRHGSSRPTCFPATATTAGFLARASWKVHAEHPTAALLPVTSVRGNATTVNDQTAVVCRASSVQALLRTLRAVPAAAQAPCGAFRLTSVMRYRGAAAASTRHKTSSKRSNIRTRRIGNGAVVRRTHGHKKKQPSLSTRSNNASQRRATSSGGASSSAAAAGGSLKTAKHAPPLRRQRLPVATTTIQSTSVMRYGEVANPSTQKKQRGGVVPVARHQPKLLTLAKKGPKKRLHTVVKRGAAPSQATLEASKSPATAIRQRRSTAAYAAARGPNSDRRRTLTPRPPSDWGVARKKRTATMPCSSAPKEGKEKKRNTGRVRRKLDPLRTTRQRARKADVSQQDRPDAAVAASAINDASSPVVERKRNFLSKWRSLSRRARQRAIRRIVTQQAFPNASIPHVSPAVASWLAELGHLPSTLPEASPVAEAPVAGDASAALPSAPMRGHSDDSAIQPTASQNAQGHQDSADFSGDLVDLDDDASFMALPINREELYERDARIAMRLLMSQHFRVTNRPLQEEAMLRRRKLEELHRPLLERAYQKQVHVQADAISQWQTPVKPSHNAKHDGSAARRASTVAAYDPSSDVRIAPTSDDLAAHRRLDEQEALRRAQQRHEVSMQGDAAADDFDLDDADPMWSPAGGDAQRGGADSPADDDKAKRAAGGGHHASVLLHPPRSHFEDLIIPIRGEVPLEGGEDNDDDTGWRPHSPPDGRR